MQFKFKDQETTPPLPGAVIFGAQGPSAAAPSLFSLSRPAVSVKDYGAVGDGMTDDTVAARAAHEAANSLGVPVSYGGLARIALQADAKIPLRTSTDFCGCELVLLGGVAATPSFSVFNELFLISDPDCPEVTYTGALTASNLTKGSRSPFYNTFNEHGFALLTANLVTVPNRAMTGTQAYKQAFKVNRFGVVSHPLSLDLQASAADMVLVYRETSKKRLVISNVALTEGAWNNQRVFKINRSNVEISGFTLLYASPDTFTFANVCEIISIVNSSDITINDYVTTGRRYSGSTGTYSLAIYGGADIRVNRMNAITGWGATGTNDVSGLYFNDCALNRVDAHSGGHNIFVDNCDLHDIGVTYGWGGGIISVKNSRLYKCSAISSREDYGGSFFGALVVADCEADNNFTSTYRLIDLETNALGASAPVHAPSPINVSNVKRIGRASAANAEFIPVAVKVREATQVVYAPKSIRVADISAHHGWRFGLRVDTLNMEADATYPTTDIAVSRANADAASASTTGILEFDSVRTPAVAVRPTIRVSDSSNIHIRNRAALNLAIIAVNCSLNGIMVDTAAAVQPLVQVADCRLLAMASGYTNAPVGGGFSSNVGHTSLAGCEIGALAWDLSKVASFIGNSVRTGSGTPLLPPGVTTEHVFTGWRKYSAFANALTDGPSVKDFGAVGDGSDATAAFSAAAQGAAAGNAQLQLRPDVPHGNWALVRVPAGTYLLSSVVDTGNREIIWVADIAAVIVNANNLNGRLWREGSKVNDFHHGTEDAAVSFSIMANRHNDNVASVSGYTNPNQLSQSNGRDSVAAYIDNKLPAALYGAAAVSSYSATGATLSTALSADQLKKVRKGMIVHTRHSPQKYAAFVDSCTATVLTVAGGWFLVDGAATGVAATPPGTDGLDINVFRKAFAMNANVFLDSDSYGTQVNAFELGLRNNKGEPASRGGAVAEANGMYVVALDSGGPSYYGDAAYLVGGKWTYGYRAYGSVTHAFYYDGSVGAAGDPLLSLIYGKSAAGVPFYQVKPDGLVEQGLRGSGTATAAGIDFHTGAADADYDSRIRATGGTGVAGAGTLNLEASILDMIASVIELRASTNIDISALLRPKTDALISLGQSARRFSTVYSSQFRPGAGAAIWTSGAGTPEGTQTAPIGSLYTRTDGGAGTTLYVKESGTGNTGWVAK